MKSSLEIVREKVIAAVPELGDERTHIPGIVKLASIQLHHVLRAIYAKGLDMKTRLNIECDGQFLVWHPEQDHKTLGPTWNLSKDLSGQSEETLVFLAEILK